MVGHQKMFINDLIWFLWFS